MRVVDVPITGNTHSRPAAGAAPAERDGPRVAVRSWDLCTTFGTLGPTWDALLAGRFVRDHSRFDAAGDEPGPRALVLAGRAADGVIGKRLDSDAAVIVGTSKGTVASWLAGPGIEAGARPTAAGLSDVAAALASRYETSGPRLTVSAACASGLHALARGAMMIRAGEVRQALVVATEASVHPLFIGSFQRLGVLARPGVGCRPFDRNREGFVMGEAAAAVLLQADDSPPSRRAAGPTSAGHTPVYLDRFALGADATHLTGGDPDARVLRHLLARVVDGRPVDLVHAHGTGTVANDETELAAIEATFPESGEYERPVLYSHKGALGHTLGAAGLVSVVLNCQAHATGVIPPNAQTHSPLPTRSVVLSSSPVRRTVHRSVATAAGFGGAMAAVSFVSG